MRSTLITALGAANMAAAAFTNTTVSAAASIPESAGEFKFYACVASEAGFPGFEKIASSDDMNTDMCAASCESKFMAVDEKDCICGEDMEAAKAEKVQESECTGLARRDIIIKKKKAISMYKKPDNGGSSVTTSTVTSTQIATITSCPPTVANCPYGSLTTKVMAVPTSSCNPVGCPEFHKKKIVCYGNYCLGQVPCQNFQQKYRVICTGDICKTEFCTTQDCNKLIICNGNTCSYAQRTSIQSSQTKIVCYNGVCTYVKCIGSECQKNLVCNGSQCSYVQCSGSTCYNQIICNSNGQGCYPAPPSTGPYPPSKPSSPGPVGPVGPVGPNGPAVPGCPGGGYCVYPQPAATGLVPAGNSSTPTGSYVIGAAGGIAANIIGAVAGLLFVL